MTHLFSSFTNFTSSYQVCVLPWLCTDKVDSRGNETVVPRSTVSCLHASEFVKFLRNVSDGGKSM